MSTTLLRTEVFTPLFWLSVQLYLFFFTFTFSLNYDVGHKKTRLMRRFDDAIYRAVEPNKYNISADAVISVCV